MLSRRLLIVATLLATAAAFVLWATGLPLGVPGEWTWDRIRIPGDERMRALLGLVTALFAAALYLGCVFLGDSRLPRARRSEKALWLGGLAATGLILVWTLQQSVPSDLRLVKPTWVLYDPGMSGYFFEAAHRIEDSRAFLAGYERRMEEGDVLHVGTHPPGLFLAHRALVVLCERSPRLTGVVLALRPAEMSESFAIVENAARLTNDALGEPQRAALWLAIWLTHGIAVATVIPLYLLARRTRSPAASWRAAALWPLVPALAVFLPKSDALYPFFAVTFLVLWLEGRARRSPSRCVLAGLVLWCGMFLSLALLPALLIGAIAAVWEVSVTEDRRSIARRLLVPAGWTSLGAGLPIMLLRVLGEVDLLHVWLQNLRNHAGFYDQYSRIPWKWLLVNPIELGFAVGWPLVLVGVAGAVRSGKHARSPWSAELAAPVACAATWVVLWLSGKNMGEAARLWLVLMPTFPWLAAASLESPAAEPATETADRRGLWILFAVQAAACIATVLRVSGFRFIGA